MQFTRRFVARLASLVLVIVLACGCANDQTKANQEQLSQQQAELDQLKQEVAALQVRNAAGPVGTTAPGGCDESVMHAASVKGGERFAASDLPHALAYYQDAVNACPTDSRAQFNLARTYESLGDSAQARDHYQAAASAAGADPGVVKESRDALARLHI